MWQTKFWDLLKRQVFPQDSTDAYFNPYKDRDSNLDTLTADKDRQGNLYQYLDNLSNPNMIILGEAPGPWGCRFSGIPFTSEDQLCRGMFGFTGNQTSVNPQPYSERSATIFWEMMLPYMDRFLVWNCFPLHPHQPGDLLSIRTPTREEVKLFVDVLAEMINLLSPKMLVAVGRSAEQSLTRLGFRCTYVRHPSHGGAKAFKGGLEKIFRDGP